MINSCQHDLGLKWMFNYNLNFGWNPFSSPFVKLQQNQGNSNKGGWFALEKNGAARKMVYLKIY